VEVVNGAAGFLRRSRRFTLVTSKAASRIAATAAAADSSFSSVKVLPSIWCSFASKACPSRSR